MRSSWLTDALCLLHDGGEYQCAPRTIEIRDGLIAGVHRVDVAIPDGDERIDGKGCLAVAGFVNAHNHSPDNLIRSSAPNLPLELWSLQSAAGRNGRSPREGYVSAMLGAIEMMRSGTTTVLDHIRISPDIAIDQLDSVAQAYSDCGMRAVIAPIVADRAVADTMPLTEDDLDGADISAYGRKAALPASEQIAIAEEFISHWHGAENRLYGAIGPSAPQRCSDELLELATALSARRDIVLHMHLLETRVQQAMGHTLYGKGIVEHLFERGHLTARTNLAHAIWIEPGDIERLAETGAAVIHNPVSNARLGSGYCPLPAYLRHGVRVGLGTDSACCNDNNNLLETAKWATLLHNLGSTDTADWVSPDTSLRLMTQGAADAIGLGAITGRIATGYAADITLFKLASPAFVPLIDPVRQLIQAENGSAVDRVLVAGRTVVANGRCTWIDEDAIWQEAQELSQKRLMENAGIYGSAAQLEAPIKRMYQRLATEHTGCCQ